MPEMREGMTLYVSVRRYNNNIIWDYVCVCWRREEIGIFLSPPNVVHLKRKEVLLGRA